MRVSNNTNPYIEFNITPPKSQLTDVPAYTHLKHFAARKDYVYFIMSNPEIYTLYGESPREVVISLRGILENELEDKQNLRSDELSVTNISKKQIEKESSKLKKNLQKIYKCYNLPFDKSDISDTFYSNPQQVISDFKNGKITLETILYEIEKNIQNKPYDTKSIVYFLNEVFGNEILHYLSKHASDNQYTYYNACYYSISNPKTIKIIEPYIFTNIFKNLTLAKQDIGSNSLNISKLLTYSSRIENSDFKGDESFSLGVLSSNLNQYRLKGLYFDIQSNGIKMKLESKGREESICIPKEIFIQEVKEIVSQELKAEETRQAILDNCNFIDISVINEFTQYDLDYIPEASKE